MVWNPSFRLRSLGFLLFALFVLYLAGVYFGGHLMTLFYFGLCLPVLSVLLGLVSLAGLRYHQEFDNEHPVKGEDIHYRLILSNESPLPIARVRCRFKIIHRHMALAIPSFSTYLKSRGEREQSYTFRCSYRGIYTVGLERIEVSDPLGLLTVAPSVIYRTFYVYPRILRIRSLPLDIQNWEGGGTGISQGGDPDYSLYTQLKPYRAGESVRHMHWKKFALTGKPHLLEYETTAKPEISIYLDTRPCGGLRTPGSPQEGGGTTELEIEDTSIEIMVALVRHFLGLGVPLSVRAAGRDIYRFTATEMSQFERFYRSTITITFDARLGPSQLFTLEDQPVSQGNRTTFFITHLLDASLLSLVEDSLATDTPFLLIFNHVGASRSERQCNNLAFTRLREKGARIMVVESAESIVEDLGGG